LGQGKILERLVEGPIVKLDFDALSDRGGDGYIVKPEETILVTGANGFIGSRVVNTLVNYGFTDIRCLVRSSSKITALSNISDTSIKAKLHLIEGNLLSRDDCKRATEDVSVIFHLAAGIEKTFPGCYMNSVVATRNLLDSVLENGNLKRFVNVSSIAVYSNRDTSRRRMLDETCEMDGEPALRHEAYVFGKVKQDELVFDYARRFDIPYVIVRPGEVFGPGKRKISGRVGINTFGIFLHLGGRNQVPLTYVDNCAEAIVLAGVMKGVNREIFNVVDYNLPTSRKFLRMYKKNVRHFWSVYIPYRMTYFLCYLWEKYSAWSNGQLVPVFNRRQCVASWKTVRYSNQKIRDALGWKPRFPIDEALKRYFKYMRESEEIK
jgi:nucleoside-diphosphate-sugar epimerase